MVVRPDFVFFDFSNIKSQIRHYMKEKHSSEAKSSDDDYSMSFMARVWFFNSLATNPWTYAQVNISPSMMTKGGYKTIIT